MRRLSIFLQFRITVVLDIEIGEKTYEALKHRVEELEREICELKQAEKTLRRQNNYLTVLHETSRGLIDRLGKQKLLETVLQRAAMLTGTEHGIIFINLTIFNFLTKEIISE